MSISRPIQLKTKTIDYVINSEDPSLDEKRKLCRANNMHLSEEQFQAHWDVVVSTAPENVVVDWKHIGTNADLEIHLHSKTTNRHLLFAIGLTPKVQF
jgi:hypothetical protein